VGYWPIFGRLLSSCFTITFDKRAKRKWKDPAKISNVWVVVKMLGFQMCFHFPLAMEAVDRSIMKRLEHFQRTGECRLSHVLKWHLHRRNQGSYCWVHFLTLSHFQSGFFGFFDKSWSERSWIDLLSKEMQNLFLDSFRFKNPILDFLKEMHPMTPWWFIMVY